MELELGLKITQTRNDLTSTTEFLMAKNPTLPVFMSTETQSKFILTAHLKGYGKDDIGIKINEDGTQIAIRLKKAVEEMVMSTWMVPNKELKMKDSIIVFKIPNGVVLDGIKAKFDEQESILTILLPKLTKGIRGDKIEQVKQDRDIYNNVENMVAEEISNNEIDQVVAGENALCENVEDPNQGTLQTTTKNSMKLLVESGDFGSKGSESSTLDEIVEKRKSFERVEGEILEDIEAMIHSMKHESNGSSEKHLDESVDERIVDDKKDETKNVDQVKEAYNEEEKKSESRKIILCKPCVIAGSAIIVSLVVIAIHWIRSRKKQVQ